MGIQNLLLAIFAEVDVSFLPLQFLPCKCQVRLLLLLCYPSAHLRLEFEFTASVPVES